MIEEQKRNLLENGAPGLYDMDDDDRNALWENEGGPVREEDESSDDGDLAYINAMLNSIYKPKLNSEKASDPKLQPFTPEGTPMRAPAPIKTPLKFNQNFDQNSMSYRHEEKNFNCFANFEEKGTTELADYFSDEEEDSLDDDEQKSESDFLSQTDPDKFGEISDKEDTWIDQSDTNFGLQTIPETDYEEIGEENNLEQISSITNKSKLAFSEWQPFIPQEHAFQNCAAPSWPSDFLQPAFSSLEPTPILISTITTTKPAPAPIQPTSPPQEMALSQLKDWHSFRPATRPFTRTWTKPWPESTKTYSRIKDSHKEFQDHPEQSKQYRLWKQRSQCSPTTSQNQSSKFQNTPPVTDVGNVPQVFTHSRSLIYLNTKHIINTAKTKSWVKKWRKFSTKTPIYQTKLQKSTRHHQKSSRRTQLWPWSQRRSPPTCSLDTARMEKLTPKQKISPRGENHFSKRRSESKIYSQYERLNSKSETKNDSKNVKVKNENKLVTLLTNTKVEVTAKADEVKTKAKTLTGFRMEIEKQLDKRIGSDSPVTLPLHFATPFNISVLICTRITFTIFILTFNIFISIFKSFVSDPSDHHFQTFTIGDLSDCKMLCLSQQTASVPAKPAVKAFVNPDSIRLFKIPESQPDLHYRHLHRNPFVPSQLLSGRTRKSENDLYHDSFIFSYLDFSR